MTRREWIAMISATLLALALIALGIVYLQQPAEAATVIPKSVADPLAARRGIDLALPEAVQIETPAARAPVRGGC